MTERSEDAELTRWLAAVARGDEAAFTALYDATSAKVYGLIHFLLKDDSLAEEVTLDTYLQVWRNAGDYRTERGSPGAWLMMLARSRAIDRLRSQNPAVQLTDQLPEDLPAIPQDLPDERLSVEQSRCQIESALRQLPAIQHQLLALAFFRGLSHSEIARHSGLPMGTVKTHIRRALSRLRALLGGTGSRDGGRP